MCRSRDRAVSRIYVLINTVPGRVDDVVRSIQNKAGVLMADVIEDTPPDIIMVVQGNSNEILAELTLNALLPVEEWIKELQLLTVKSAKYAVSTPLAYHMN
jgi:hypothetical protein